jgi:hypothetical protein
LEVQKSIQNSHFSINLKIQCHVLSVNTDVFSTLILKWAVLGDIAKTMPGGLMEHNASAGSGGTRIACSWTCQKSQKILQGMGRPAHQIVQAGNQ